MSVVIPAFNLAGYLPAAIDSALAQDRPGGDIEVIVVDDGSTDETPEVLAGYTDRVKAIRQRNHGLVGAVNRALAEVRGEFVALLDADDEWPQDRLRRHVSILEGNPTAGLVHGDMELIDVNGATVHRSFFERNGVTPRSGRVLGDLLSNNFVSGGASTFRASLLPAIHPIVPEAAYPDWWIAACTAAVADIVYDPATSNRYRYHGANMGLGARPDRQPMIYRQELPWRRWMMCHLVDDPSVQPAHLAGALQAWHHALGVAASTEPRGCRSMLETDPAEAAKLLSADTPSGGYPGSKTLLRAFSRDPFDGALAIDLQIALLRELREATPPEPLPPALIQVTLRQPTTIAWLDELVADPWMLRAYADACRGRNDSTLLVLAGPHDDLSRFVELVDAEALTSGDDCDIVVIAEPMTTPARTLLAARASGRLSLRGVSARYASLDLHEALGRVGETTAR